MLPESRKMRDGLRVFSTPHTLSVHVGRGSAVCMAEWLSFDTLVGQRMSISGGVEEDQSSDDLEDHMTCGFSDKDPAILSPFDIS